MQFQHASRCGRLLAFIALSLVVLPTSLLAQKMIRFDDHSVPFQSDSHIQLFSSGDVRIEGTRIAPFCSTLAEGEADDDTLAAMRREKEALETEVEQLQLIRESLRQESTEILESGALSFILLDAYSMGTGDKSAGSTYDREEVVLGVHQLQSDLSQHWTEFHEKNPDVELFQELEEILRE